MFEPLTPDSEAIRALNNVCAEKTSYIEPDEWLELVGKTCLALFAPPADAFLLAMDQTADYASPNFQWWRAQRERFLYVDRIVVAEAAQGRGIGRALYARVIDEARALGLERVVCEINIVPPNPESLAFHEVLGFVRVGGQDLQGGKSVAYFEYVL